MNNIVMVVDTETTGLEGYPNDEIVELAINEVNLDQGTYKNVFNQLIGHNTRNWDYQKRNAWIFHNSSITLNDVHNALPYKFYKRKVESLVNGKQITSYNRSYDFDLFLDHYPYGLGDITIPYPCIMLSATDVCQIEGYYGYKWPRLNEAYDILVGMMFDQTHRAVDDTNQASQILIKLFANNQAKKETIKKFQETLRRKSNERTSIS